MKEDFNEMHMLTGAERGRGVCSRITFTESFAEFVCGSIKSQPVANFSSSSHNNSKSVGPDEVTSICYVLRTQRKSNTHTDARDGKTTRDDMESMLPAPHPV